MEMQDSRMGGEDRVILAVLFFVLLSLFSCEPGAPPGDDDTPDPIDTTVVDVPDFDVQEWNREQRLRWTTGGFAGFNGHYPIQMINDSVWFWETENLRDTSWTLIPDDWETNPLVRIITPDNQDDLNDPSWIWYLVTPGRYTVEDMTLAGTGWDDFKRILYFDPNNPAPWYPIPCQREGYKDRDESEEFNTANQAVFNALRWKGEGEFVGVHGLLFRTKDSCKEQDGVQYCGTGTSVTSDNTRHIWFDYVVWEGLTGGAIRLRGDDCGIQRFVIQNRVIPPPGKKHGHDIGAPGIEAQVGEVSEDCFILFGEVEASDGFGLTYSDVKTGTRDGAIIENNDFYNEEFVIEDGIRKGRAEEGFDIKAGSSDGQRWVQVLRNRIFGFPGSSEDGGTGGGGFCVVHVNGQKVWIEGNIMSDGLVGATVFAGKPSFPEAFTEDVIFYNNLMTDVRSPFGRDTVPDFGVAWRFEGSIRSFAHSNTLVRADGFAHLKDQRGLEYLIRCQSTRDVDDVSVKLDRATVDLCGNVHTDTTATEPWEDLVIWVKPWTGPEPRVLKGVIPPASHVMNFDDCDCGRLATFNDTIPRSLLPMSSSLIMGSSPYILPDAVTPPDGYKETIR